MNTYLIIDIGTGNVRVALISQNGKIIWIGREDIIYKKDAKYEDALFFDPEFLWKQILRLIENGLAENKEAKIAAITTSSQREGIVLLDKKGKSIIGFPNHDHRGRFMENTIQDKNAVYNLTGRYPTSLFSALKLAAYREKYPAEWKRVDCFLSISDWAQFQLTGIKGYEHAQASETLLYDVKNKCWSDELFSLFNLNKNIVPPLHLSGTKTVNLKKELAELWNFSREVQVIVGGADTQLAIKSTQPKPNDIVIVSGTTTPIVNITTQYVLDKQQRSWTNSDLNKEQYILETNCGVTGLNFQRMKDIFYPDESYQIIEEELDKITTPACYAHLGSLLANDKNILTNGGFLFEVPVMTTLSRSDFVFATLWDIACSVKENLDCLLDILPNDNDYVWCCGGGFQSRHLRKYVAGLTGKKLLLRPGYQQASVSGAAVVCNESFNNKEEIAPAVETVYPKKEEKYKDWFKKWKETRKNLKLMR